MRPTTSEGPVDLSLPLPAFAGATATGRRLRFDVVCLLGLSAWVAATRAPYLNSFDLMGKDGPLYVNALRLDASYDVPMPGNLGYVLLGKLANLGDQPTR